MPQGRGGSSESELRVPGVGLLDWRVLRWESGVLRVLLEGA